MKSHKFRDFLTPSPFWDAKLPALLRPSYIVLQKCEPPPPYLHDITYEQPLTPCKLFLFRFSKKKNSFFVSLYFILLFQIYLKAVLVSWTTTTCATSRPSNGRRSSRAPTPSCSITTSSASPNGIVHPATSPAQRAAGAKELTIVKSSQKWIAAHSAIKDVASGPNLVNVAIFSVPEVALAQNNQIAW